MFMFFSPVSIPFGQPSNLLESSAGSVFPFTDIDQTDPETGQSDGLLFRLTARAKVPKIFLTNTSSEYWGGHAALTHVDSTGTKDIRPSDSVRIYHFSSTQHNAGVLPLGHTQDTGARGLHPFNWVDWRPLMRAAVDNLDAMLEVPGIDGIFVGPNDMSISLGIPDQYDQKVYLDTVKGVIDRAEAKGIATLVHQQTPDLSTYWISQGARFILHGTDRRALQEGFKADFGTLRDFAKNN